MLRYEQIIKDVLENDNCKMVGLNMEGSLIIRDENDRQKVYKCRLSQKGLSLIIRNINNETVFFFRHLLTHDGSSDVSQFL